jgi:hypothetical protein
MGIVDIPPLRGIASCSGDVEIFLPKSPPKSTPRNLPLDNLQEGDYLARVECLGEMLSLTFLTAYPLRIRRNP